MKLDEAFDLVVSRPLARWMAPRFHRAGFSADQVSLVALVCGVGAGLGLAMGGAYALLGGLFLVAMVVIDCADGEVARLGPPSDKPWRGRIMDGIADLGTVISVHVAMYIVLTRDGLSVGSHALSNLEIALLVVLGFMSFSWKSSVLDDIKQRLRPASVDRDLARYEHQDKTLVERFLFWLLVQYVASAERLTGDGRPGGHGTFRLVSHVGPTHHLVAIAAAGIVSAFVPNAFLAYLFATIIPGNLYLWAVLFRARRRTLAGI